MYYISYPTLWDWVLWACVISSFRLGPDRPVSHAHEIGFSKRFGICAEARRQLQLLHSIQYMTEERCTDPRAACALGSVMSYVGLSLHRHSLHRQGDGIMLSSRLHIKRGADELASRLGCCIALSVAACDRSGFGCQHCLLRCRI